jgi:hypothetical protein
MYFDNICPLLPHLLQRSQSRKLEDNDAAGTKRDGVAPFLKERVH